MCTSIDLPKMNTPAQFFLSVFRAVGFNRPVTDYSFSKARIH